MSNVTDLEGKRTPKLDIKGIGHIKLYNQPLIQDYWPKAGTILGKTVVTVRGLNFDPTMGGIFCKFENQSTSAVIIGLN